MNKTIYVSVIAGFIACLCAACLSLQAQTVIINTIAGNGGGGFAGDGGLSIYAEFNGPSGIAVTRAGTAVYVADELNQRIRKVVYGSTISTYAGSSLTGAYGGDGGAANLAKLYNPFGIAMDTSGNLYIADNQNYRIRVVNAAGVISTIGGTGVAGYTGDGGAATIAKIGFSQGITVDRAGNVYYADDGYNVVRKINTAGIITTVAGNGTVGFGGDGGAATLAMLNTPRGLRVDAAGNLYIADAGNDRVRKVDVMGNISSVASVSGPWDVALDAAGNMYITSYIGNGILKVDPLGGTDYIVPLSLGGFAGDGCAAVAAKVAGPAYLALDSAGDIFFSDRFNGRVRVITHNHAPAFTGGHSQSIGMCTDSVFRLDTVLAVAEADYFQPERWTLLSPALHGAAVVAYPDTSTGSVLVPVGLSYTPAAGYAGPDMFKVVVTDCTGAADTTTILVTVVNCSLGTGHLATTGGSMAIFPNPANGAFSVELPGMANEEAMVTLTNAMGEKVYEKSVMASGPVAINANLAAGIYFVKAVTSGGSYCGKVVVSGR